MGDPQPGRISKHNLGSDLASANIFQLPNFPSPRPTLHGHAPASTCSSAGAPAWAWLEPHKGVNPDGKLERHAEPRVSTEGRRNKASWDPLARYHSSAHSFPDYGAPHDMGPNKERLRAINGATKPVNSLHRSTIDLDDEPSPKRRRHHESSAVSRYFSTAPPTAALDAQGLAGNGSHDVYDVRSVSSSDRPSASWMALPEYRKTNEKNAVNKPRRRRRSTTAGTTARGTKVVDLVDRDHSPDHEYRTESWKNSATRTSPDVLNDPPPANVTSDIFPTSGNHDRSKVLASKEQRYKRPRLSDRKPEEISADELSVDGPGAMQETVTKRRITNFTGVASRHAQKRLRDDIKPTNSSKSPRCAEESRGAPLRIEVRRAASGKFNYGGNDKQPVPLTLVIDPERPQIAQVRVEGIQGSSPRELHWINITREKVYKVEHSAARGRHMLIRRSRTDEATDDLALESSEEGAMELVYWLTRDGCVFSELSDQRLAGILNNKMKGAREYANSNAYASTAAHSSSVNDRAVASTSTATRDPFRGEQLTPRPAKLKDRMNQPPSDEVEETAPTQREIVPKSLRSSQAPETRRTRWSSPARQMSPERWTSQNPDWSKNWHRSLVFPAAGRNRATVDRDDIPRLDEGEFLNDNLISFYFRYLQAKLETERPELLKKVYFFSTFFFEKLRSGRGKINYEGVKAWTAKVDLLSHDYVIVPVNEHAHWYLAIICNTPRILPQVQKELPNGPETADKPGDVKSSPHVSPVANGLAIISIDDEVAKPGPQKQSEVDSSASSPMPVTTDLTEEAPVKPKTRKSLGAAAQKFDPTEPRIITLDSLGSGHSPTCKFLREYLIEEAKDKKNLELAIVPSGMTAKNIPEQNNYCDCGVFVLGYIEEFLKDPDEAARKLLQKEDTQWDIKPSKIRNNVRDLLFKLQHEQNERLLMEKEMKKQRRASKGLVAVSPATPQKPSDNGKPQPMKSGDETPAAANVTQAQKTPTRSPKAVGSPKASAPLEKQSQSPMLKLGKEPELISRLADSSPSRQNFYSAQTSPARRLEREQLQDSVDLTTDHADKMFVRGLSTSSAKYQLVLQKQEKEDATCPEPQVTNGIKRRASETELLRPRKSAMLSPIRNSIEVAEATSSGPTYDGIDRSIDMVS